MPATIHRRLRLAAACAITLPLARVPAQQATLAVERTLRSAPVSALGFEVSLGAEEAFTQSLRVTARFHVEGREPVLLSMPAWTPGSYEIANFARQVSEFAATQDGAALRWEKVDPDTWRVVPSGRGDVVLTYRVKADTLDNARAWTREDFGFFNGTTVFLTVEGFPALGATVRVTTEAGWRIASGMTPGAVAGEFVARDSHDLLDHPFFVGKFDFDSTRIAGSWVRLATYPVGSVEGDRRATFWRAMERAIPPMVRIFGEVPWRSYTILQVADPAFQGMGALEHTESELAIVGTPFLDEPFVVSVHAHEVVHAWNVKRLRPADLFPYRYDRAQPTTWLWMSEGITDYYADLALVRGGVSDESVFLGTTLGKIDHVSNVPVVSLEDASLQAWIGMTDGTADIYYDKGSLAGLAIDILIRDATDGVRGLDDVMRELWNGPWKQRRGFTDDDFWNAVTRAANGRAFGQFAQRYIDGREPYPWQQWLPLAGWRIVEDSTNEPRLGARLRADSLGVRVDALDPDGAAARGGLEVGDVITAIGGRSTLDPAFGDSWRAFWGRRPGATMTLDVRRGHEVRKVDVIVEVTTLIDRRISPDPNASERARRVRAGILRGTGAAAAPAPAGR